MVTTVYLVRHAQSQPRAEQPDAAWALSERGRQQAEALAPVLQQLGIAQVYTSPFRRCLDTVRPFAALGGVEVQLHDGLRERHLGDKWLGDFREVWRRSWEDFSFSVEGGESSWSCQTRMMRALADIAVRERGKTVAVCSHGNAIGLLMHAISPSFGMSDASAIRTPELFRVLFRGEATTWDRTFLPGADFDSIATDFRLTPGIVA